jgi:hypothetical protein
LLAYLPYQKFRGLYCAEQAVTLYIPDALNVQIDCFITAVLNLMDLIGDLGVSEHFSYLNVGKLAAAV